MKKSNIIVVLIWGFLYACTHNKKTDIIVIQNADNIQQIEIVQNDSTKTIISLQGTQIISITKYVNKKLNGEQLSFHKNELLSKKLYTINGITDGHRYEFYESGAYKAHTFYKDIYPAFFEVEYWDGPYGLMKRSTHYKDRGEIERVRLFDTLGNVIKDSVPN